MAREKLFAEKPEIRRRSLHDRFREFATRVMQVSKEEIDRREAIWRAEQAAKVPKDKENE